MSRGFGVTAGLDPEIAAPLAARCQELGNRLGRKGRIRENLPQSTRRERPNR